MARHTVYNRFTSSEKLKKVNPDNIELGEEFLGYLLSIDRAESTIKKYRNDLNIFWCWNMEHNKNKYFPDLTKRELVRFQNMALNTWNWSSQRIRRVKSCLSSMSNYIQDILDEEEEFENFKPIIKKIENPKLDFVREKTVLPDEQVEYLLQTLVKRKEYEKACSVAIAAYSGMRKSELLQMKESFFTDDTLVCDGAMWETPKIRTKGSGKSGKQLEKYILIGAKPYIDLWIKQRKELNIDNDTLFVSKVKTKAGEIKWNKRSNISHWTEEFSEILNTDFYYHSLRHFTCSMLMRHNIPADIVQEFFGWSSADMLKIYNDNSAKSEFSKYFSKNGIIQNVEGSISDI